MIDLSPFYDSPAFWQSLHIFVSLCYGAAQISLLDWYASSTIAV